MATQPLNVERDWIDDAVTDNVNCAEVQPDDPCPQFPAELKKLECWVVWKAEKRDGKPTKVPYGLKTGKRADITDSSRWATYEEAVAMKAQYNGIGLVITPPYVGIDLDKCRNPETSDTEQWARDIIAKLDSYTELSPSGRGFHIWVKPENPLERGRRHERCELYPSNRYLTVTGDRVSWAASTIRTAKLDYDAIVAADLKESGTLQEKITNPFSENQCIPSSARFDRLMQGDWKGLYRTQSEADLALCCLLVRKHGSSPIKIESEFNKSQLAQRDKWKKREDYRRTTIQKAICFVKDRPEQETESANIPVFRPAGTFESSRRVEKILHVERFADITAERLEWVWEDRIPAGKLTVLAGNPDVGKSLVTIDIVARASTGQAWPGSENVIPACDVLMLVTEDDLNDTVKPRLMAAGADMDRVQVITGVEKGDDRRDFALDTDIKELRKLLQANLKIRLLIVDPISSFLGSADLNKEKEVRRVLTPFAQLAHETGIAVVAVAHFNKTVGVSGIHKIGGAVALVGVPRMVWGLAKNDENPELRLMAKIKGNVSGKESGLSYKIATRKVDIQGKPTEVAVISWEGTTNKTLDEVLSAAADPEEGKLRRAIGWLRGFLPQDGKMIGAGDMYKAAEQQGYSAPTVRRAKVQLRVKHSNIGGKSMWSLAAGTSTGGGLALQLPTDSERLIS